MIEEFDYNSDDYDEDGFLKGSPFHRYEVVEIRPLDFETEPEVVELIGKRGVLTTCSFSDDGWAYSLAIQSGECWCFDAAELTSLGTILTQAELYGPPLDKQEWARINSDGECIAGDPSFLRRGPTPLFVNLEQLVLKG